MIASKRSDQNDPMIHGPVANEVTRGVPIANRSSQPRVVLRRGSFVVFV